MSPESRIAGRAETPCPPSTVFPSLSENATGRGRSPRPTMPVAVARVAKLEQEIDEKLRCCIVVTCQRKEALDVFTHSGA